MILSFSRKTNKYEKRYQLRTQEKDEQSGAFQRHLTVIWVKNLNSQLRHFRNKKVDKNNFEI